MVDRVKISADGAAHVYSNRRVISWLTIIDGLWIVIMIISAISGGLGCILNLIWPVLMLAIMVLHVMCIMKGIKGERLIVPGVSELADRF